MDLLSLIGTHKIIAILRKLTCEEAVKAAGCLENAGIRFVEVTFDAAGPSENTLHSIETIRRTYPGLHVGAGTVLTPQQVHDAYQAGAEYIISPNTDPEVIELTKKYDLISIPGALSPTEIVLAYSAGADIVKLFPVSSVDPSYIKALKGPLPHIPLAAVGGVNLTNIKSFLQAGAYCVGIGSEIVPRSLIQKGDYQSIEEAARIYVHEAE
ncbi:bifunctional 4-hydroxy-2-oxoglutarate aldolase/2-dehydro-3-deoxy-phosphogluconate aldolase [Murimonas intestini]|uniref:bifunctional 4-hydroxy-2-oxoglutarate aldolase/2-dehydro-3-deoxy-phosphogluconate aldolase n=1 Tax=Murimonas intestini TaxID=1337051 RepID=UPI00165289BD|nr:bifunctional 4-hydroxy-2-oxoglutarate aldolase/2-dehydro-3-deoxy-phosphogluconate aldolase [Murimonas intestini]